MTDKGIDSPESRAGSIARSLDSNLKSILSIASSFPSKSKGRGQPPYSNEPLCSSPPRESRIHHRINHPSTKHRAKNNNNNDDNNKFSTMSSSPDMERVLFHLHQRACNFGLQRTSGRFRRLLEHFLLVSSILMFGALILLHRSFVVRASGSSSSNCATTCFSNLHSSSSSFSSALPFPNNNNILHNADVTHIVILPSDHNSTVSTVVKVTNEAGVSRDACLSQFETETERDTCFLQQQQQQQQYASPPSSMIQNASEIAVSFSTTKGYLLLPHDHPLVQSSTISTQYVFVSRKDANCFGEPFLQSLVWTLGVGSPETIVKNWIVAAAATHTSPPTEQEQQQSQSQLEHAHDESLFGYVYNPRTKQINELPKAELPSRTSTSDTTLGFLQSWSSYSAMSSWWRWRSPPTSSAWIDLRTLFEMLLRKSIIILQTSFLYFFCTTLVSFTLLQTQEQMLGFTQELSRRVHVGLPLGNLITSHLIQTLLFCPIMIGMIFFLMECYQGDKFLAFLVLSTVWCVEVFSIVSLRSYQGITFFPRTFFLLFCLFHVYHFANPNGFGYTAFGVIACFMFHSMVFFWHRYELPAMAYGIVTIDRPRFTAMNTTTATTTPQGRVPQSLQTTHTNDVTQTEIPSLSFHSPNQADTTSSSQDFGLSMRPTQQPQEQESMMIGRNHPSFLSISSDLIRTSSEVFRSGDDDSYSSYAIFMEGEVVLHRSSGNRQAVEQPQTSREELDVPTIILNGTATSSESLMFSEDPNNSTSLNIPSLPTQEDYSEESSGLQAILEGRLTPRQCNTSTNATSSSRVAQPTSKAPPPRFPELPT